MKGSRTHIPHPVITIVFLSLCSVAIAQEQPTVKPANEPPRSVKLSLIAVNDSKHSVDDVNKDDIEIREDGVLQNVSVFSRDERKIVYGMAFDTTGSFRALFEPALQA